MNKDKDMPETMDLSSMDVAGANKTKLKALFPSVFTETRNESGELIESIDFEKLKAELGTFSDVFEKRRERYGMDWPGKKDCMRLIQQPSVATLKPCREESVDFDNTENLFIEGDNLEVLKLLQKSYYNKVKMIYIDPPYNTGKEFIYPDKYSETLETYLAYAGLVGEDGKKFATNTPNEGRFHTKWLNMMYPRLYLARNLLREDGAIFISIDEHEYANLIKICDEIFGESSFVGSFVWQSKKGGGSDNAKIVVDHEYVVLYVKSFFSTSLSRIQIEAEPLDQLDDKGPFRRGRELNKWGSNSRRTDRPTMFFPIKGPNGDDVFPIRNDGVEGCWRWGRKKMYEIVERGDVEFVSRGDGTYIVYEKIRKQSPRFKPYRTFIKECGTTADGSKIVKSLFDDVKVYDFPKPIDLVSHLLAVGNLDDEDIILDFFAGSCTTAHAVMNYNQTIGSRVKYVLVQLPEPCDEKSDAVQIGLLNITNIGKERIRRVIKQIELEQGEDKTENLLSGLDERQHDIDLGFKVFKLDRSNFKLWDGSNPDASEEEIQKQLELHIDHIDPQAGQEDILYELLLKAGYKPTDKVETRELANKTVYSIDEGALLICLEDEISRELIDAVAEAEPIQFICLDRGFQGNDQLKANAVQTFAARNQGRDKMEQIVFRTV